MTSVSNSGYSFFRTSSSLVFISLSKFSHYSLLLRFYFSMMVFVLGRLVAIVVIIMLWSVHLSFSSESTFLIHYGWCGLDVVWCLWRWVCSQRLIFFCLYFSVDSGPYSMVSISVYRVGSVFVVIFQDLSISWVVLFNLWLAFYLVSSVIHFVSRSRYSSADVMCLLLFVGTLGFYQETYSSTNFVPFFLSICVLWCGYFCSCPALFLLSVLWWILLLFWLSLCFSSF